jgi:hypothetical protein
MKIFAAGRMALLGLAQKLRQLGDVRRDPPRFIFAERVSSCSLF